MGRAPERPRLETLSDAAAFREWYCLKAELLAHCRQTGLRTSGAKAELADRIAHYLETRERRRPGDGAPKRPSSRFDWAHETITPETVITDSYRNGPNVRAFFVAQIGPRFRFNIAFMAWMRANTGNTMGDAVAAWRAIDRQLKQGTKTEIPAGNQYNRYVRDFFAANPGASLKQARACWLAKRSRPGPNAYEDSDLRLIAAK